MTDREPHVQELLDLSGKKALITGATGYLGSAMARGLAEAGAAVVVSSRSRQRAQAFAETLPAADGVAHHGVELDHIDPASIDRGFAEAIQCAQRIDILVNNGNLAVDADWKDVTAEQFNQQLANGTGYFLLARLLRNHVVERGAPGNVILLGSMYGQVGSYPQTYRDICKISPVGYHMLKGGVIHMARHLAVCWASDRVRVNCLSPGPFPRDTVSPVLIERLSEKSPLGRMGLPHELKGAIVFLASDASSYMTGQNLTIDGGWTAW